MWFEKELAKYQNDTRAALSLFLPLPDGAQSSSFRRIGEGRNADGHCP